LKKECPWHSFYFIFENVHMKVNWTINMIVKCMPDDKNYETNLMLVAILIENVLQAYKN